MWKLKLQPGQQLFFTSDTHYNHKNICRGVTNWRTQDGLIPIDQTRDFKTLERMNSTIVNNINNKVGQDDILIHLGDWSFGGFESIKEFRDKIICKNIYLIYGNHDHHIENNRDGIQSIFTDTFQYAVLEVTKPSHPILTQSQTTKHEFVLMHYPLTSWHDMSKGRMHLFGHVHLRKGKNVMAGRAMDVGMDGNNLTPYSLSEILITLKDREIKATSLPSDHHEERLKEEKTI